MSADQVRTGEIKMRLLEEDRLSSAWFVCGEKYKLYHMQGHESSRGIECHNIKY